MENYMSVTPTTVYCQSVHREQTRYSVSAVSHMKAIESHMLVKVQCKRKWQVNSTAIHVVSLLCTVNLNSGVG